MGRYTSKPPVTGTFRHSSSPDIHFGAGVSGRLADLAAPFGRRALLVTGAASLKRSGKLDAFLRKLKGAGISCHAEEVSGEPSPEAVDGIVKAYGKPGIDMVIGIGGGAPLDAAKAIAAMLTVKGSVVDFLEGVGTRQHPGTTLPCIAVPTTAGTGSEATKNAVISRTGPGGFKKSLRHDHFVPAIALVDPELAVGCPLDVTAACGMDALTQLIESFTSTKATPFTDALCLDALARAGASFLPLCEGGEDTIRTRSDMAYAALISGIGLANAGLGVVHGLASPIGGVFPVPHGVVCGTLIAEACAAIVEGLLRDERANAVHLARFSTAGQALTGKAVETDREGCMLLVDKLREWTEKLAIPRLGAYGLTAADTFKIAAAAGNKNSPYALSEAEIGHLLIKRI